MKIRILRLTTLSALIGLSLLAATVVSTQETPLPPTSEPSRTPIVTHTPAPLSDQRLTEILVIPVRQDPDYPYRPTIRWAEDSKHVFVTFTGQTQIIDVHTGWIIYESPAMLRFLPGDYYFAVDGRANQVQIRDLQTGGLITVIENTSESVSGNAIRHVYEQLMVVGIHSSGAILFDLQTMQPVEWTQSGKIRPNAQLSPDLSKLVTYYSEGFLRVFDVQSGELLDTLDGYWSVDWSPDSRRLIVRTPDSYMRGSTLDVMQIWTPGVGLSEPIYNTTGGWQWSPDGSRLATGSDHTKIRIWDADTGELLQSFKRDVPISPRIWHDSTLVSFRGDGGRMIGPGYTIINVQSEEEILNIGTDYSTIDLIDNQLHITEPHRSRVLDVETGGVLSEIEFASPVKAISPDQRWAVVADWDDRSLVFVIDMVTGETVSMLTENTDHASYFVWSPDSTKFAMITDEETIRIWQLNE